MNESNCCPPNDSINSQSQLDADAVRQRVREDYGKVARANNQGDSSGNASSCCGVSDDSQVTSLISTRLGYASHELNNVPEGADMGLGCGNPGAIASLQEGETVVDLGSGGGFDCFLASPQVGNSGHVIGVDMTADMVSKARANAVKGRFSNVEFRLGEIENLPVADNSANVIISNCVINLSPDKPRVFQEAYRVLAPGGRLAISDVVASAVIPDEIRNDPRYFSGCMAGAAQIDDLKTWLEQAGFQAISIEPKDESREFIRDWAPEVPVADYVVSASIEAVKPE